MEVGYTGAVMPEDFYGIPFLADGNNSLSTLLANEMSRNLTFSFGAIYGGCNHPTTSNTRLASGSLATDFIYYPCGKVNITFNIYKLYLKP